VAQLHSQSAYDHTLVERVVRFLQTKDPAIFPFTEDLSADERRIFMRELRDGLADLQDSGSARKTSAAGFIMRDSHLRAVVDSWYKAFAK
jgi:hypothetical protein